MNRLVIIGNGFDLAHGLPTSYKHFIDDYWVNIKDSNHNDLISFNLDNHIEFKDHTNLKSLIDQIVKTDVKFKIDGCEVYKLKEHLIPMTNNRIPIINYNNEFFRLINQDVHIQNWVDIENLYYSILKEVATSKSNKYNYILDVKQLNDEFEAVKKLLENYLHNIKLKDYNFKTLRNKEIETHLRQKFLIEDFTLNKEQKEHYSSYHFRNISDNLLLSFNYTDTVEDYSNALGLGFKYNYIHGKLTTNELPIIFGFGDEMDEDYSLIENINENEYLKNFKSIQYLEFSTYKNLYNFIESEPFQVFIMGHSCGLSDRTLLSTIFENDNCLSVKIFYHQISKEIDNYKEIIQNISRHFKDKKMLRNKVVEKRHCKPLIEFKSH